MPLTRTGHASRHASEQGTIAQGLIEHGMIAHGMIEQGMMRASGSAPRSICASMSPAASVSPTVGLRLSAYHKLHLQVRDAKHYVPIARNEREGRSMLLRHNIYKSIRSAILTCEFQPGQELREQILAERYRVSRSPIRDSLLRLEQENLVTVLPRQGYRVNPISRSDIEDIFDLRLLIEPACAVAAARADGEALQALDRFRDFASEDRTEIEFVEYNGCFHRAIADLSGNTRMAAVAVDLDEQFERLVRVSLRVFRYEQINEASAEHDAIIDAIQAHDAPLAARLCYQLSASAQSRIALALRLAAQHWDQTADPQTAPPLPADPTSPENAPSPCSD
jgi:DNA-binding GntR family transcriptional regulator